MLNKKKPQVDSVDTIIGADTVFEGKITSKTSLRVEGTLDGEVHLEGDLTVGTDGRVTHDVQARNVTLAGHLSGNLTVSEKLHILSSGHFEGKARIGALIIEDGAVFDGESQMNKEKTQQNQSDETKEAQPKKQKA
ncbi:polymer-forming cytoskeletal protein [Pontibacillus sp. HMF3514]|uniref:bactofilin family protein n=1 Tax=Pontibacillus sp. HMF3514 TaxID=2692425 RepID=UPI00131F53B9|nr:polymer-forming cytoskeletal protein [Pontibacillus sp. HMF3514]QHE53883.1 hypothetical protein GS400_18480 [Pontibacillus sp. HMF3514]